MIITIQCTLLKEQVAHCCTNRSSQTDISILVDDFVTEVRVPTRMELLYHTNTHYDCVVDSNTNTVCQTPPLLTRAGQESTMAEDL